MPASPLARVRFLARLEAAESAVEIGAWDSLDSLVRELSPLALEQSDPALLARFDAVFAATDREGR
jgi:hypothetical protein